MIGSCFDEDSEEMEERGFGEYLRSGLSLSPKSPNIFLICAKSTSIPNASGTALM
jgi:hypothetical protein